jgi:hypothetical protein
MNAGDELVQGLHPGLGFDKPGSGGKEINLAGGETSPNAPGFWTNTGAPGSKYTIGQQVTGIPGGDQDFSGGLSGAGTNIWQSGQQEFWSPIGPEAAKIPNPATYQSPVDANGNPTYGIPAGTPMVNNPMAGSFQDPTTYPDPTQSPNPTQAPSPASNDGFMSWVSGAVGALIGAGGDTGVDTSGAAVDTGGEG